MADRIEPAASPHEWQVFLANGMDQLMPRYFAQCDHPSFIAKHNAALPDSDRRKITREWVTALRQIAQAIEDADVMETEVPPEHAPVLRAFANALESYLPPESLGATPLHLVRDFPHLSPELQRKLDESL